MRVPRVWSLVVTVVVAAGVVAAFGVPMVLDVVRPPGDVVVATLEESVEGEVSAVVGGFAANASANVLPTPPRDGGFTPPSDVRVSDAVKSDRDDARVSVSYRLGNERRSENVEVTREGLFAPWRIDAAPPTLNVEAEWPVDIRIAGVAEKLGAVAVVPGRYEVGIDDDLFTAPTQTVVVGLDGRTVELRPKLKDDAADTASRAVNAELDECAASTQQLTLQSQCPFFETRIRLVEPTSVAWTITNYPGIRLEPADDGELAVDTAQAGEAVLRWDFDNRDSERFTCRFNVDGTLTLTGKDMDWSGNPISNMEGCEED